MRLPAKGGAEVDLPSRARRRRDSREVACEHLRRRHVRNVARRHLAQRGALVGAEEKECVAHDRAAQRAAELVAPEAVIDLLAIGADRGKVLRRVETTVAQELEAVSRERVGPRLGHRVDRRARLDAPVGGKAARRHLEFLERIRERQRQNGVALRFVVRRTVQRIGDAKWQAAANRDEHAALDAARGRGAGLHSGAGEHDQVGDLASLQRQLQNGFVVDDRADARAADVDERRRGLHRHRFLQRANGQHRVHGRCAAHLQDDARLHVRPESLERDLEPVGPGRKVRQQVAAGFIGHGRASETGVGLCGGNGYTGQHGAAFIANRPTQLRCRLRPGGACGKEDHQSDA